MPEQDSRRRIWVKEVYDNAVIYLKRVCDTFQNYTLHDERHVLNVLYAMGAILGNQIERLSVGEVELGDIWLPFAEKERDGEQRSLHKYVFHDTVKGFWDRR